MTTAGLLWILGLLAKSHPSTALTLWTAFYMLIEPDQDFPFVENSAGYCYLKIQQMAGVAPSSTQSFILLRSAK